MSTNRTNGPWRLVGNSIYSVTGTCITETQWGEVGHVQYPHKAAEATANAAFIVEACNAHDELVAQRDALAQALRQVAQLHKYGEGSDDMEPDGDDAMCVLNWHIDNARAALAKVQP